MRMVESDIIISVKTCVQMERVIQQLLREAGARDVSNELIFGDSNVADPTAERHDAQAGPSPGWRRAWRTRRVMHADGRVLSASRKSGCCTARPARLSPSSTPAKPAPGGAQEQHSCSLRVIRSAVHVEERRVGSRPLGRGSGRGARHVEAVTAHVPPCPRTCSATTRSAHPSDRPLSGQCLVTFTRRTYGYVPTGSSTTWSRRWRCGCPFRP